jgi:hypothetical protein
MPPKLGSLLLPVPNQNSRLQCALCSAILKHRQAYRHLQQHHNVDTAVLAAQDNRIGPAQHAVTPLTPLSDVNSPSMHTQHEGQQLFLSQNTNLVTTHHSGNHTQNNDATSNTISEMDTLGSLSSTSTGSMGTCQCHMPECPHAWTQPGSVKYYQLHFDCPLCPG